jgi:lipid-binding SYLF domain-containing protein
MNRHRSLFVRALFVCLLGACAGCERSPRTAGSETTDTDREHAIELLGNAAAVVRELPETDIPVTRREKTRCVVVIPSMVSGGLLIGARHGRGVASCRTKGQWSGPVFVTVNGGSAGFQAGLQSSDLVMLVMSERGVAQLFRESFELGADVSAAAGPVGKGAQASTDTQMNAEILTYSRSRGLFAGAQVSGAVMQRDRAADSALYGSVTDVHPILAGEVPTPKEAAAFVEQLTAAFPRFADDGGPTMSKNPS